LRKFLISFNAFFIKIQKGYIELEALKGDLEGFYSIRINDQYRIIFRFENGDAYDVAIVDYH
jgi:plasmid maintenance system killer protein